MAERCIVWYAWTVESVLDFSWILLDLGVSLILRVTRTLLENLEVLASWKWIELQILAPARKSVLISGCDYCVVKHSNVQRTTNIDKATHEWH